LNKRSLPFALLGCILAAAGGAGYFLPDSQTAADPTRLLLENPGGRIVFTHKAHRAPGGRADDIACSTCHHELRVAPASASVPAKDGAMSVVMPCTACHGAAEEPDFLPSHQERHRAAGGDSSCLSCHHTRLTGLSEKWNHQEHQTNYADDDCESCHHPTQYAGKPGRVMTIKPQRCANCHTSNPNPLTATTRKEAVHARCASCHSDLFEAKTRECAACHTLAPPTALSAEDGSKASYACASCHPSVPGGMDAFHGSCRGCHDKEGKGPGKEAPCTQCHTP
jgi:hypothetical protein